MDFIRDEERNQDKKGLGNAYLQQAMAYFLAVSSLSESERDAVRSVIEILKDESSPEKALVTSAVISWNARKTPLPTDLRAQDPNQQSEKGRPASRR